MDVTGRLLAFFFAARPPPSSTLFPYTTLFRSERPEGRSEGRARHSRSVANRHRGRTPAGLRRARRASPLPWRPRRGRSEEHTSELQSHSDLVCRLLLEKKKTAAGVNRDYQLDA